MRESIALAFTVHVRCVAPDVEHWGDPKSLGGGAVGITPVERIPMPVAAGPDQSRSERHGVADSVRARKAAAEAGRAAGPDAIALKSRNSQKKTAPRRRRRNTTLFGSLAESGLQQHGAGGDIADVQSGSRAAAVSGPAAAVRSAIASDTTSS